MPEVETEPFEEFRFKDPYDGETVVKVWCEGRDYDPNAEAYRPVYSYSIVTPKWRYDDNSIHGGANELPNLRKASQSLFAFIYAAQESWQKDPPSENAGMFPEQVNMWAHHYDSEISQIAIQLEEENARTDEQPAGEVRTDTSTQREDGGDGENGFEEWPTERT